MIFGVALVVVFGATTATAKLAISWPRKNAAPSPATSPAPATPAVPLLGHNVAPAPISKPANQTALGKPPVKLVAPPRLPHPSPTNPSALPVTALPSAPLVCVIIQPVMAASYVSAVRVAITPVAPSGPRVAVPTLAQTAPSPKPIAPPALLVPPTPNAPPASVTKTAALSAKASHAAPTPAAPNGAKTTAPTPATTAPPERFPVESAPTVQPVPKVPNAKVVCVITRVLIPKSSVSPNPMALFATKIPTACPANVIILPPTAASSVSPNLATPPADLEPAARSGNKTLALSPVPTASSAN